MTRPGHVRMVKHFLHQVLNQPHQMGTSLLAGHRYNNVFALRTYSPQGENKWFPTHGGEPRYVPRINSSPVVGIFVTFVSISICPSLRRCRTCGWKSPIRCRTMPSHAKHHYQQHVSVLYQQLRCVNRVCNRLKPKVCLIR